MRVWGLIELELQEAVELYSSEAQADEALRQVLRDEPGWIDLVAVQPIELEESRFALN